MTSVNLENTLENLKIQENLAIWKFTEFYLCTKEYFDMFSSIPKFCKRKMKEVIKLVKTLWLFV